MHFAVDSQPVNTATTEIIQAEPNEPSSARDVEMADQQSESIMKRKADDSPAGSHKKAKTGVFRVLS